MQTIRAQPRLRWRMPLIVIGLLVVAVGWWFRPWFESGSAWAGRGLRDAGTWISERLNPKGSVQELTAERDALQKQLLSVSLQLAEAQRRIDAGRTLASLEDFLNQQPFRTITAAVVSFSPDPGVESLVIQQGIEAGISDGMVVISDRGVVVGIIARTQARTSIVRLLPDTQSRLLARVQNEVQSRGLLLGERGLSLRLQFLPHQDQIEVGQAVVTSGLDPKIPADLLIGTIERIDRRAGELFQSASLRSPVEFNRLRVVAVVLGSA